MAWSARESSDLRMEANLAQSSSREKTTLQNRRTNMGFRTDAIHAGQEPDPSTGAIVTPIFQTSTYVQEALGKHKGFEYARTQNPTRFALERNMAALERGVAAYAFASGMAATNAITQL